MIVNHNTLSLLWSQGFVQDRGHYTKSRYRWCRCRKPIRVCGKYRCMVCGVFPLCIWDCTSRQLIRTIKVRGKAPVTGVEWSWRCDHTERGALVCEIWIDLSPGMITSFKLWDRHKKSDWSLGDKDSVDGYDIASISWWRSRWSCSGGLTVFQHTYLWSLHQLWTFWLCYTASECKNIPRSSYLRF